MGSTLATDEDLDHRAGVPEVVHVTMDSFATAITFAQTEIVSDQIVTRAQGKQEDSRVLQGTWVRDRLACF
jgi:hypothetical protein